MQYDTYRLCHGCRAKFANQGLIINGIFYCEDCSARRTLTIRPFSVRRSINRPVIVSNNTQTLPRTQNNQTQPSNPRKKHLFLRLFVVSLIIYIVANCYYYKDFIIPNDTFDIDNSNNIVDIVSNDIQIAEQEETKHSLLTQQEIRTAISKYNSGDYWNAVPILKRAAEQEHAEGCFYYGQALRFGNGTKSDISLAVNYLKKAADGGYYAANNSLGICYRNYLSLENATIAYKYFQSGSNFNDPYALLNYASCFEIGYGTEKNVEKAIQILKMATNSCRTNEHGIPCESVNRLCDESILHIIKIIDDNYIYQAPGDLAKKLTNGLNSTEDKIYVIFRWLTENIEYDTSYKISTAANTYNERKGVCAGYARLFQDMCKACDINAEYITGKVYQNGVISQNSHAWNKAYTGNRYIYLDTTWAAGFVTKEGTFIREYDSRWWDPDYETLSKTHLEKRT